jgi:hypothetical protein
MFAEERTIAQSTISQPAGALSLTRRFNHALSFISKGLQRESTLSYMIYKTFKRYRTTEPLYRGSGMQ